MSKTTIPRGGITADAIDATLIADDAISEEHIDATVITASTALAAEPADTDEFLISDAGTIKRIDYSYIKTSSSFTKIATVNSTSASSFVELQNCFNTTYQSYLVILRKVLPSTNLDGLRMRLMTGTNTAVNSSNYAYASRYFDHDGAVSSNTGNNQSSWHLADQITSSVSDFGSATGVFWFSIDTDNSSGTSGKYTGTMTFGNTQHSSYQGGKYHSSYGSTTTTGLEWFATSGNIAKLQATCYGVTL